jgi:hypothetical protein
MNLRVKNPQTRSPRRLLLGWIVLSATCAAFGGLLLAQQPFGYPPPSNSTAPYYSPYSSAVYQPAATPPPHAGSTMPGPSSSVPIFNPRYPNAPQGGWPGYGYGNPYGGGYGGYLNGAANLTVANAQYNLTTEQARIVREEANRQALQTQRATIKEMEWERKNWLQQYSPYLIRERQMATDLRIALYDPTQEDIWSGEALNSIFTDLKNAESMGRTLPSVPLNPQVLAQINLNSGDTYVGAGMLRHLKFDWPWILRQSSFDGMRQNVEQLLRKAVAQVKAGGIDITLVNQVKAAVSDALDQVGDMVQNGDITPTECIDGTRYLNEIKSSLQVLTTNDATNYFNGTYDARGATVAQLVQNMASQGLKFAPAPPGADHDYASLYRSLVTEEYRLREMGAR